MWFAWTIHTLNMKAVSLPKKSEKPTNQSCMLSHSLIVLKHTNLVLQHFVTHA
jgi:hypothetical protein